MGIIVSNDNILLVFINIIHIHMIYKLYCVGGEGTIDGICNVFLLTQTLRAFDADITGSITFIYCVIDQRF